MPFCLTCGHVANPDREMAAVEQSDDCACRCHPWNWTEPRPAFVDSPPDDLWHDDEESRR